MRLDEPKRSAAMPVVLTRRESPIKLKNMKTQTKLETMPITGGLNGYPTPEIGQLIHGFDSFADARSYANEFGSDVYMCHYRDGWSHCELSGQVSKAKTIHEFIDNERESVVYIDEDTYKDIQSEDYDTLAQLDGYDSFADLVTNYESVLPEDACKDLLKEKYATVSIGYNVYDMVNCVFTDCYDREELMSYRDDTHNYLIGVVKI